MLSPATEMIVFILAWRSDNLCVPLAPSQYPKINGHFSTPSQAAVWCGLNVQMHVYTWVPWRYCELNEEIREKEEEDNKWRYAQEKAIYLIAQESVYEGQGEKVCVC